jgi:hypothetical protein
MRAASLLSWLSYPILILASPLEERAATSACNNAQVKALRSSNAACFCSSYLKIPLSTITKVTTSTSTTYTTITRKQFTTK